MFIRDVVMKYLDLLLANGWVKDVSEEEKGKMIEETYKFILKSEILYDLKVNQKLFELKRRE